MDRWVRRAGGSLSLPPVFPRAAWGRGRCRPSAAKPPTKVADFSDRPTTCQKRRELARVHVAIAQRKPYDGQSYGQHTRNFRRVNLHNSTPPRGRGGKKVYARVRCAGWRDGMSPSTTRSSSSANPSEDAAVGNAATIPAMTPLPLVTCSRMSSMFA